MSTHTTTITAATAVDIVARPGALAVFVDGHRVRPERTMRGPVGAWAITRIGPTSVAILGVDTDHARAAETADLANATPIPDTTVQALPIVAQSSYSEGYWAAFRDGTMPGANAPLALSDPSALLYGLGLQAGWQDRTEDRHTGASAIRPI